jgi:hypothetical protein
MKTVLIQKRRSANNPFDIVLGNGSRLNFSSKRALNQFMAETNRFLTQAIVNINMILIESYREYRIMWFVATNVHKGTKTNYERIAADISENLKSCEMMLYKFGKHYSGSDDPFFGFIDILKAARYCMEAARKLEQFHKKRNDTQNHYSCGNIANRCQAMISKIESYNIPDVNLNPPVNNDKK